MDETVFDLSVRDIFLLIVITLTPIVYVIWLAVRSRRGHFSILEHIESWISANNFLKLPSSEWLPSEPIFPTKNFLPEVIANGKIGQRNVSIGYGTASFSDQSMTQKPFVYFQTSLLGRLPGRAFIRTRDASWIGSLEFTPLESTMFKGFIATWTHPKNLSTLIMSPDFMDWYERVRPRPCLYIKEDTVCLFVQQVTQKGDLEHFASQLDRVVQFIERSGALEKKDNSA